MKPTRRMRAATTIVTLAVALICWPGQSAAQDDPAQVDPELREAMTKFFHQRVRAELALTDEQTEAVMPLFTSLEQTRNELRRKRGEIGRTLHRRYEAGAGDQELQGLLDDLDAVQMEEITKSQEAMSEIDALLTVRQRVKLRFFLKGFQDNMKRRIQEIRSRRQGQQRRPPESDAYREQP